MDLKKWFSKARGDDSDDEYWYKVVTTTDARLSRIPVVAYVEKKSSPLESREKEKRETW